MGRGSPFRADISTSGLTGPSNCPSNSHPLGAPNLSWFQRSTTQVTFNHIPRVRRTYCVAVRTELPPFAQGSAQHTTSPPPAAFNACAFQRSLFEFARQPAQRRNPLRHHRHQRRHRISQLHRLVHVLLLVLLLVDIRCPLSLAHSIIRHSTRPQRQILLQYYFNTCRSRRRTHRVSAAYSVVFLAIWAAGIFGVAQKKHQTLPSA